MSYETPDMSAIAEQLKSKWSPILEHADCEPIKDSYRRNVTAVLLENQEQAMIQEAAPANSIGGSALGSDGAGAVKTWDPVLISLVRRAMPNLMAYDVCGVQPMTGPTGLIFALKAHYKNQSGNEALYNEAATQFGNIGGPTAAGAAEAGDPLSSTDDHAAGSPLAGITVGHGMATSAAEALGSQSAGDEFGQMAFTIERTSVVAKTRALKAEYTTELAQDLKAVHGLDAETELANILSNEVLAEINREVIRTIYKGAQLGAQQSDLYYKSSGVTSGLSGGSSNIGGIYDLTKDSDGRWSAEKFRGLLYQIERECNKIAKSTRRGKGNLVICSSDVASALAMGGFLQLSGGDAGNLNVDDTGNTFVGTIGGGRIKVYVDPYASIDYVCAGYKGSNQYDAGLFYCPYVPLQMVRAVGENSFQPKIGFKTRYGMVNNPFVGASYADPSSQDSHRRNQYYRIFRVDNLTPAATV